MASSVCLQQFKILVQLYNEFHEQVLHILQATSFYGHRSSSEVGWGVWSVKSYFMAPESTEMCCFPHPYRWRLGISLKSIWWKSLTQKMRYVDENPGRSQKCILRKEKNPFGDFQMWEQKKVVLCQREILVKTKNTVAQLTACLFPQLINPSHASAFQMQRQSRIRLCIWISCSSGYSLKAVISISRLTSSVEKY